MLIDWYTVGAQVLNFLILVYLLKRFLYGPIVRSMDRREERIAGHLREAAEKSEAAAKKSADLDERLAELARKKELLLKEAGEEAEGKRRELLEGIRREAEEARRIWREEIASEREAFVAEFTRRAAKEIISLSSRVLRDLTGKENALSMVDAFLDRVGKLEPADREKLASGAAREKTISVRTSQALSDDEREKVVKAVSAAANFSGEVNVAADETMSPGIELLAAGVRIAWSVDDYLEDLEKLLEAAIEDAATSGGAEK